MWVWVSNCKMCNFQKKPPEMFCKKGVLRNFAKYTGKHLCQSLFFDKVVGLQSTSKRLLPGSVILFISIVSLNGISNSSVYEMLVAKSLFLVTWVSKTSSKKFSWKPNQWTPKILTVFPCCFSFVSFIVLFSFFILLTIL